MQPSKPINTDNWVWYGIGRQAHSIGLPCDLLHSHSPARGAQYLTRGRAGHQTFLPHNFTVTRSHSNHLMKRFFPQYSPFAHNLLFFIFQTNHKLKQNPSLTSTISPLDPWLVSASPAFSDRYSNQITLDFLQFNSP